MGCRWCIEHCPENAIDFNAGALKMNQNRCRRCYNCIDYCPTGALSLLGKAYTVSELMAMIEREAPFLEDSNGGVTLSGGEPFYNSKFLLTFIQSIKEKGFHVALDTSGYTTEKNIMQAAGMIDLFLYDIKCIDTQKHIFYTGVSNKPILSNLKRILEGRAGIQIRYPCIPGVNDTDYDIEALMSFLLPLPWIPEIRLLRYHDFAMEKYKRVGIDYELSDIEEPTENRVETIKGRLNRAGIKCEIGG